ncbi:hypothetical protein SAMN03080594_109102 [Arenibacter palladensis]|uniref:Uncharacterized protein n=1 Tax=Arenibacter palladensis TaxID=237373 RepID=A0A1M5FK35_9FLAO|nr:hypothetical protein SAMN03080594_109102 [Arenibacter palladensis]
MISYQIISKDQFFLLNFNTFLTFKKSWFQYNLLIL